MLKAKLIMLIIKIVMWLIAIGIGIWYLSSSVGGTALSYSSLNDFLTATGACAGGNCDIGSSNGCFLCGYIEKLFSTIGVAAESFWVSILDYLWILLAVGFGIYLFIHSYKYLSDAAKENASLADGERSLDLKKWFEPLWKQGARVLVVGAFLGVIGLGGPTVLRTVSSVTITPVMFVGSELAMAATGVSDSATCGAMNPDQEKADNVLTPVMGSFMCVIGNLNTVLLAGAASGFSMMNYSWLGLGGGLFTWIAGLALVIMFLIIGFGLFFDILNVIFMLVFVIIFLPILIASAAFAKTWKLMDGVLSGAIDILAKSAVKVIGISLKIVIIYALVSYSADEYFPGPNDGYSSIMIPISTESKTPSETAAPVAEVFSKCELEAKNSEGLVDKEIFKSCFIREKTIVESAHPGAFDFMDDGWSFLMMMIGVFLVYEYVVKDKIDKILGGDSKDTFQYGTYIKEFGQTVWNIPKKLGEYFTAKMKK